MFIIKMQGEERYWDAQNEESTGLFEEASLYVSVESAIFIIDNDLSYMNDVCDYYWEVIGV